MILPPQRIDLLVEIHILSPAQHLAVHLPQVLIHTAQPVSQLEGSVWLLRDLRKVKKPAITVLTAPRAVIAMRAALLLVVSGWRMFWLEVTRDVEFELAKRSAGCEMSWCRMRGMASLPRAVTVATIPI